MNTEQDTLLYIVQTWNINEAPEYRGFRCANCQEYKNEAWYHWVDSENFLLPIHLCNDTCEQAFKNGELTIDPTQKKTLDRKEFGEKHTYSPETVITFHKIVSTWSSSQKPLHKAFTCDLCEKDLDIDPTDEMRKGWHVWWNNNGTLTELHFHKQCGDRLFIS